MLRIRLPVCLMLLCVALGVWHPAQAQQPIYYPLQSAGGVGNGTAVDVTGYTLASAQVVTGIGFDRTITFEMSVDGTNYIAVACKNFTTIVQATTATANGLYACPVAGAKLFRARISGGTAGTATVSARLLANAAAIGAAQTPGDLLATYILQVPDAILPNAQALSALATGYVKVTTGTGVLASQAVPFPVADGGTGLTAGTSGGILGYTATGTLASSGLLTANALLLGGGAGATPTPLGSLGTTTTLLHGNAAGAPTFGAVVSADLNITTTSCTNQFVTALSSGAVGTCTTVTLAGAQFANQGTTTTVLHGNAAGNPSFGPVALTTDVSGILPGANGGTGNGFFAISGPTTSLKTFAVPDASATLLTTNAAVTLAQGGTNASLVASNGGLFYSTATAGAILSGTATAGQIPRSGASAAPSWSTATYPATIGVSELLYGSSANVIGGLATANNGVLITSGAGVPSISATLPAGLTATTNFTTPLLIGGTGTESRITYKSTTGAGTATSIAHQWLGGTDGGTVLATLLNNGNFGVLTAVPTSPIHVIAAANASIAVDVTGTANSGSLLIENTTDSTYVQIDARGSTTAGTQFGLNRTGLADVMLNPTTASVGAVGTVSNAPLIFGTNNIERARFDVNGNLGFHTSTFGTSAVGVFAIGAGTAPSTSPADVTQLWTADWNGAGTNALFLRNEEGVQYSFGSSMGLGGLPASSIGGALRYIYIGGSTAPGFVLDPNDSTLEVSLAGTSAGMYYDVAGHGTATNNIHVFRTSNTNSSYTMVERVRIASDGTVLIADLKTTGAATGKKVVCVDTTTGQLYASSTGVDCSN